MDESKELERKQLLTSLLDAVKQCQLKFNGKSHLATEKNESVRALCSSFENVFKHGLKELAVPPFSLKQFTDVTGLSKLTSMLIPTEDAKDRSSTFWRIARLHLSRHELERFDGLKNVKTDAGKVKAWFRSALNEHSLERYLHSMINHEKYLRSSYECWSFMLDDEKAVTLPNVAAGLSSVLFALSIDRSEFDENPEPSAGDGHAVDLPVGVGDSRVVCDVRSKRRKKQAKVINFDDDAATSDEKLNPCDDRNVRRSAAGGRIVHRDVDKLRHSGAFSLEDEHLNGYAFINPSKIREERLVSLSKSDSDLKRLSRESIDDGQMSRCGSFTKEHVRDSDVGPRPVDCAARVIDIGGLKFNDPDTTSESYGSYDSRDLICADFLEQTSKEETRSCGSNSQISPSTKSEFHLDEIQDEENREQLPDSSSNTELWTQNMRLKNLLAVACETNRALQEKLDRCVDQNCEDGLSDLQRENTLLREQLKGYIAAIQNLQLGSDDATNDNKQEEANEMPDYEQKLVQIAEMHAELVEFNEVILKKLALKEVQLEQANRELSLLNRPQKASSTGRLRQRCSAIDTIIPSAFLHGSPTHSYHVYQIYIKIGNEEWNVYRRYTEFYDLHCELKKHLKNVKNLDFPPKRTFGKKDPKVVEERRRRLEEYLKKIVAIVVEKCQKLSENPSRQALVSVIPFFDNEKRSWNIPGHGVLRLALSNDVPARSYAGL